MIFHAGIVDEKADLKVGRCVDNGLNASLGCEVGHDDKGFDARSGEGGGQGFQAVFAAGDEDDGESMRCKLADEFGANAGRGASDKSPRSVLFEERRRHCSWRCGRG